MMDNLIAHAKRELDLFTEEDPEIRASLLKAVEGFATYDGHSGGSAYATIELLNRLLRFRNLTPLTDDATEWIDQSELSGEPMWQNRRNSEAFSDDGGATFWLLSDGADMRNRKPRYDTKHLES